MPVDGSISIPDLMYREWIRLEHRVIKSLDLRKWPKISEERSGGLTLARIQLPSAERRGDRVLAKSTFLRFKSPTESDARTTTSCLALSSDGKLLAASWRTVDIIIWRTSDGLTLQSLGGQGHADSVTAVAFSPDSRRLVSGSTDKTAIIWNIGSSEPIMRLRGHTYSLTDVAFSPDGVHIVTGSADYVVKFWNAKTGLPLCTFSLDSPIRKLVFSPDGSRLAAMLEDMVALYDAGTPIVQLGVIRRHDVKDVRTVAFSPTGDRILVYAGGRVGRIYRVDSCEEALRLEGQNREIAAGSFSPDGYRVASVLVDNLKGMMSLQDASRGAVHFEGRIGSRGNAVAFSPDGTFVAAAGDINVIVWNARSGELIANMTDLAPRISNILFLPDSRRVLFAREGGPIDIWNVADTLRIH
ncbi:uncharacterized protein PHACADRAFT_248946 [Phanerochaete carnosa HHB-10118-sp]|uniref:Uncharacterized protein n=1 Tax=Phanerochaete carnosa (strain HHB-10118-sp) TaxID=650164 RepID=K5WID8_PHACS|nr:uncharacterized protein PHACADRAFT_248946 [Phanerochaete carnosa HHB-10118-sp]EKM58849.1 hypothetical protein PHACADRAFT_248946 [Phanerochaete carnosa HHB-10118-sp]